MAKSKRIRAIREQLEPGKTYGVDEALELLKSFSKVKFTESVEVAIRLGVDPRKSDQVVRGALVLPHGTGKSVRVAVFAQGENAEKAEAAGADIVGMDDLAETIKGGQIDFDVCIATPDAMRVVGKLGQVLGPRGLMPNPKVGTVTTDVETAVKNAKAGQVQFRTDKGGIVHSIIGKVDFDAEALKGNLVALVNELMKSKPPAAKGQYLRKVALSTTMGPGLTVDAGSLSV
ncbi:50S ribosomal protein L1 [Wenzhouxiangella sp. XN201]|jgi:large subunit ribosomal protein L1|uniref:50S ribosomal protein L1 n=1 Tax=Wenzhouxiangella sp. XN201 TaxID=2710755 RepID=UPI0013CAFA42|nr:50S ribosomal protein L1 [Wenzhouxiangella sp. XN201]NEZ02640.1 50S ribosomal protein L1 [Wenzhouxiangella sp. XN201]